MAADRKAISGVVMAWATNRLNLKPEAHRAVIVVLRTAVHRGSVIGARLPPLLYQRTANAEKIRPVNRVRTARVDRHRSVTHLRTAIGTRVRPVTHQLRTAIGTRISPTTHQLRTAIGTRVRPTTLHRTVIGTSFRPIRRLRRAVIGTRISPATHLRRAVIGTRIRPATHLRRAVIGTRISPKYHLRRALIGWTALRIRSATMPQPHRPVNPTIPTATTTNRPTFRISIATMAKTTRTPIGAPQAAISTQQTRTFLARIRTPTSSCRTHTRPNLTTRLCSSPLSLHKWSHWPAASYARTLGSNASTRSRRHRQSCTRWVRFAHQLPISLQTLPRSWPTASRSRLPTISLLWTLVSSLSLQHWTQIRTARLVATKEESPI